MPKTSLACLGVPLPKLMTGLFVLQDARDHATLEQSVLAQTKYLLVGATILPRYP
jgi:hypothetical protein